MRNKLENWATGVILDREQMKQIKGGVEGGCCKAGSHSFCDNSTSLVDAWADFWTTAGYDVYCDFGEGDPLT